MDQKKDKLPVKRETPLRRKMKEMAEGISFASLEKIEDWKKQREMIQQAVEQVKKHIAKQPEPYEQTFFYFIPTDMTRTSPFFPMNRREMGNRPFEEFTWETSWGKIAFSGKRLAIYDETILLVLLSLTAKHRCNSFLTTQHAICKLAGVKPATDTYNAIWRSIDLLASTVIHLETWKGKGRNRETLQQMTGAAISWAGRDKKTGKLKIVFNPYFLQMYTESFITNIDFDFRRSLRGDVSKALYRFYRSQRGVEYRCHILTLAKAVNLNMDLPLFKLRDKIRQGLRELKSKGYLSKWTMGKDHVVSIWKRKIKTLNNEG